MQVTRNSIELAMALMDIQVGDKLLYLGTYDRELMDTLAYLQREHNMNFALREDDAYGVVIIRMEDSLAKPKPTFFQRLLGGFKRKEVRHAHRW